MLRRLLRRLLLLRWRSERVAVGEASLLREIEASVGWLLRLPKRVPSLERLLLRWPIRETSLLRRLLRVRHGLELRLRITWLLHGVGVGAHGCVVQRLLVRCG